MESKQLYGMMRKIAKDCRSHGCKSAVIGHNSQTIAGIFARLWMEHLYESIHSLYYIDLATPAICQYGMYELATDCGFRIHVAPVIGGFNGSMEIYFNDGSRHTMDVFENVEQGEWMMQPTIRSRIFRDMENGECMLAQYKHEPTVMKQYFLSLISDQIPPYQIRRSRYRIVAGFDDPCYSRFVIQHFNSLGCKVIPYLYHTSSGQELSRMVLAHQAVCGIVFDDCLNVKCFSSEQGDFLEGHKEIHDVLLKHFFKQHSKHMETVLPHSLEMDGIWIMTRMLEWMASTNTYPSEIFRLDLPSSPSAVWGAPAEG
ncbi:hypothetical protein LSG31_11255 [Fodinisporobacter ferrooxydans]|uniref:Uncharacterized protein n=1 Tax=Fodinisporobacter ferrooxydans TaxID=2901836 RepID=A0ABY4CQB1_9BACL|nr:hypothetical protein LSG31_11255 [Alicyclobacillaceae bacterium MYW30-H2]